MSVNNNIILDGEDYIGFLKRRFENIDTSKVKFEHQPYMPYDSTKEIITFGDIHGDLRVLVECLKLAGCIDTKFELPKETLYKDVEEDIMKEMNEIIEREKKEMNEIIEREKKEMKENIERKIKHYDLILRNQTELKYKEKFDEETKKFTEFLRGIEWICVNTYVVQLGDMIDRIRDVDNNCKCDVSTIKHSNNCFNNVFNSGGKDNDDYANTLKIYAFITVLNDKAKKNNSKFIPILGNHEFNNTQYDFRYVSMQEAKVFQYLYPEYYPEYYPEQSSNVERINMIKKMIYYIEKYNRQKIINSDNYYYGYKKAVKYLKILLDNVKKNGKLETENNNFIACPGSVGRMLAYTPGQLCANWLAIQCVPFLQIGEWVFVHGGLTNYMFDLGIANNINSFCNLVRKHLLGGNMSEQEIGVVQAICLTDGIVKDQNNPYDKIESIFICRSHSDPIDEADNFSNSKNPYINIDNVLTYYNSNNLKANIDKYEDAKYMVIAHSPQFLNKLALNNSGESPNIWRCDVAMSRAFNLRKKENDDNAHISLIKNENGNEIIERNPNRYPQVLNIISNGSKTANQSRNQRRNQTKKKPVNKQVKSYTYKIIISKKANVLKIDNPSLRGDNSSNNAPTNLINGGLYGEVFETGQLPVPEESAQNPPAVQNPPVAQSIKLLIINFE